MGSLAVTEKIRTSSSERPSVTMYRYEAARTDGAAVRGILEAATMDAAAALLSARGLYPVRVREQRASPGWRWGGPSARARALVFQSLASLVEAGVPLEQALAASTRVATGALAEAMGRVTGRVREGASLAGAVRGEPILASGVTVGLLRAGEQGVGLGAALTHAAEHLEREAETVSRIQSALAYPVLLAVVGTVSVGVIVVFVVPRFVALLADLGQSLPFATRVLIDISHLVRHAGLVGIALVVGGVAVGVRVLEERRVAWHEWLLGLPFVGAIRHAFATARVSRTLSVLLGTGTPVLSALRIAREAAGDAAVAQRLQRAEEQVAQGTSIASALGASGALTETAQQLVVIGEGAGRLSALLGQAAALEDRRAERQLATAVTLLEPALILCFAGLVAFVAAALLQAVYSLRPGL